MKYAVNMGREKQTAVRVASGVVKYIVMGATTLIVLEINGIIPMGIHHAVQS